MMTTQFKLGSQAMKVAALFMIGAFAAGTLAPQATAAPRETQFMPPNEGLITTALRQRGIIPAGASQAEARAAYLAYITTKLKRGDDHPNPLGAAWIARGEANGQPRNNHGRVMRPNNQRFDNILVLLVEFAGTDIDAEGNPHTGPLHNELLKPPPGDIASYWVPDFNTTHYQKMLFDRSPRALSMANYYLEQSSQTYTMDGATYGWVRVPHSEWWYGADTPNDGIDNFNGPVWRLVQDAVANASGIPWKQFDVEDPYDLDGDGNFHEPDGYVDHVMIVHAGAGQELGGGAQGESAIWSHSWWVNFGVGGPGGYGGAPTSDPNVWVGPYTMMPEDGAMGVYAHEFGHDLGLPDLYDTIYSGDPSTAFWTLMAFGSWLPYPGQPQETCPAPMGAWEKYALGWIKPVVVNPGEVTNVLLRTAAAAGPANKAIQVKLPDYDYQIVINTPHSGNSEWYAGTGHYLNNTLTRQFALPADCQLSFWTWYDIEEGYDYGYVEVSTDAGQNWLTLPDSFTGNSGGLWVPASFDLSAYSGQTVLLRFRYATDTAIEGSG
jgi:immune inhibitor A